MGDALDARGVGAVVTLRAAIELMLAALFIGAAIGIAVGVGIGVYVRMKDEQERQDRRRRLERLS